MKAPTLRGPGQRVISWPPMAGVDRSAITVRSVTGVVETPSEMGGTLTAPFTCRAYFIGDQLSDSLVVLEHDH